MIFRSLAAAGSAAAVLLCTCAMPVPAQGRGIAYVSNQQGGVSVIDLATLEIQSTLDVSARGPRGIGLSGDGRLLVTANMGDENISVLDTATGKLLRQVKVGKNPEFVRVVGSTAFVTFEPRMASGPGPKPEGKASGEEEEKVPGHIAVIDLETGGIVLDVTGKPETEGLEFSASGREMIVTNESDNSLSEIEVSSGRLLRSVSLAHYGNRPRGIKRSPDGHSYLITLELSGKMLVLDAGFAVVKEVATGKAPYGVSFDRSGKRAFVASNKDRILQVFDATTWEKVKDIPSGERCWHFTFTPDDQQILMACGKSNEVVVVDASRLEVIKRIGKLNTPWGIVTFPRSMGSID